MYFITVSEMMGTEGESIAREAAKVLNYNYYGEHELLQAAQEMGYLSNVQLLDERGPHLFEKLFSEKPKINLDRLQSVILELAQKGDAVFFGKGSQLLLRSFECALHVLVTGSMEKRIERAMEEHHVGREVAEKIIDRSDSGKKGFLRYAYDEDWLNPKLYDLVLNTDKLSVESAVKVLTQAAKSEGVKACGVDSVKSLRILSLTRKVESALLEQDLASPYLFYTVEDADSVRLYGIVGSAEAKKRVEDTVRRIKEIKQVTSDLTVPRTGVAGE